MKKQEEIAGIKMRLRGPVVIIGMMGAGKTTLARKLAERLDYRFYDSDQEIEKDHHLTVKQIFEKHGEAFFRRLEEAKIAELLKAGKAVISVGGGAITSPLTAEAIFTRSLCLWLDAPVEILVARTAHQGSRPLLEGRDAREALEEKLAQRKSLYEKARFKIDASGDTEQVIENALGQIAGFLLENEDEV